MASSPPDASEIGTTMADDQTNGSSPWWPSLDARRAAQAERRRARRQGRGCAATGRSRERTSAEELVATAVRIIDADGLDALTVRRLASELGVAAMTVYSYIRSEDKLLDIVVDGVAGDIALPPGKRLACAGASARPQPADNASCPSGGGASHQRAADPESERVPDLRRGPRHSSGTRGFRTSRRRTPTSPSATT